MKNYTNKSNTKRKGAVLVMVISAIGLVGVVMLFLSSASNTMMFQANDFYLEACERNLTISGLNWAKTNLRKANIQDFSDTIQLDVNDMNILHSSLNVIISSPEDGQHEIQINTTCGRARQNLSSSNTFIIKSL
ncbi:MAG: hypothetical protein JW787_15425 [Sedimentisphaerales bacterium]|nr:hypothetical protein [Sedimentisphaerales bacterium]